MAAPKKIRKKQYFKEPTHMKFLTEIQQNGAQQKFQGVQKSKRLNDFFNEQN